MATAIFRNTGELKREFIKYVRDFIKKDYRAKDSCYICGSITKLELHHILCLAPMVNAWLTKKKVGDIVTVEQAEALRTEFAKENEEQLSNKNLYTLCEKCHERLHSIYGLNYENSLASKVKKWLEIQREKNGIS